MTHASGCTLLRHGAEWLGRISSKRKIWAVVWTFGVFLALPLLLIALTSWIL